MVSATTALPRGPHRFTREQVEASQRERILVAMAQAVGEKGFANTSVAEVVSRAGVSRATFYDLFAGKDDCFAAAYDWAAQAIASVLAATARARVSAEAHSDPIEQLRPVLRGYLGWLGAAPGLARTFLVEVYAAGPAAIEQRHASLGLFVDLVADVIGDRPGLLGNRPEQRFAVEALVSAVSSMVTHLVGTGQADRLPELEEPLMEVALQLGHIRTDEPPTSPEGS